MQEVLLRFRSGDCVVTDVFRKAFTVGQVNALHDQFHRVRLYNALTVARSPNGWPVVKMVPREAWTLFRAGPKHGRSWGFMNYGGRFTPANGGMR
jgi:hypothetical protein